MHIYSFPCPLSINSIHLCCRHGLLSLQSILELSTSADGISIQMWFEVDLCINVHFCEGCETFCQTLLLLFQELV